MAYFGIESSEERRDYGLGWIVPVACKVSWNVRQPFMLHELIREV